MYTSVKKVLIIFFLTTTYCYAQMKPVFSDGTNFWSSGGADTNFGQVIGIITSPGEVTNIVDGVLSTASVAFAATVTGVQSGLVATAWQNPADATNWTWTSDGTEITLTGYTGPNDVVIPDMLDGLPVTSFGHALSPWNPEGEGYYEGSAITSISGGRYITSIANSGLQRCSNLTSVAFLNVTSVLQWAFSLCDSLTSVSLPAATTLIGGYMFAYDPALTSVTYGQNAPEDDESIFTDTPNATNYVSNPTATGWGATFGGRPVVRMPIYEDKFQLFDFGIITTNATPDNYAEFGPVPYALTVTNLALQGNGGSFVADYYTRSPDSNFLDRVLCYTGATYTAGSNWTNLPVSISVSLGQMFGVVITNGASMTNAHPKAQGVY